MVVIVYKMPEQAQNTLLSLTPKFQQNVSEADYEVVVVENTSDRVLGEAKVLSYGKNFRYHLREDKSVSPADAINFGVKQAQADMVGIMVDGARMLTPGVLQYVLAARRMSAKAVVSVPGYHLGDGLQQNTVNSGYDEDVEKALLKQINWPHEGYRLFEISCLSGSCSNGFFNPNAESNCLCLSKKMYHAVGGCDTRFDMPGGGYINLDLYKRVCEHKHTELFILPGEGTFHQFHKGVTTGDRPEKRKDLMEQMRQQYQQIRGEKYTSPVTEAIYLGKLSPQALRFIHFSAERAIARHSVKDCAII
jgi:hypothetical protein